MMKNERNKDELLGNLLKFEDLIQLGQMVMMFKIDRKLCLESLWDESLQICQISCYDAENCRNLVIANSNLETTKAFIILDFAFGINLKINPLDLSS